MTFINRVVLDFGDFGNAGRYAILVDPITWRGLTIDAGFITDGATVPRVLWWFLPRWGDRGTIAAIFHDKACELLDQGTPWVGCETRALCDKLYLDIMLDLGFATWYAKACWAGVRAYSIFYEPFDRRRTITTNLPGTNR